MTLRLSSACSNQLSYAPNRVAHNPIGGVNEIRTRGLLLAKQALYQLSYDPKSHWAMRPAHCASTEARAQPLLHGSKNIFMFLKTEKCDAFERSEFLRNTT